MENKSFEDAFIDRIDELTLAERQRLLGLLMDLGMPIPCNLSYDYDAQKWVMPDGYKICDKTLRMIKA